MAPNKSIADQLRARLLPSRGHPEEVGDDEQEEFNPHLYQLGASDLDKIVGTQHVRTKALPKAPLRQLRHGLQQTPMTILSSNRVLNKNN